ncbi:hypothetical protein MMC08_002049 [Hypocenomyce scalaris]|nr:hypothetical protein [Hypocenomyce scalaris]
MEAPKDMAHFKIDAEVEKSSVFRRVLWTGKHSQVVIMNVPRGGEIGEEIHTVDQHLTFTSGTGKAIVNGKEQEVSGGSLAIVPAGAKHNFINTGDGPLLLYTVYAPAEHDPHTVHKTKEEGDQLEEEGKDEAPKFK